MRALRAKILAALLLGALTACTVSAQSPTMTAQAPVTKEPEVPFVPTNEKVVDEMLKVAKVSKNDVLYDLGSGDGRIPITAAQRFGTRGIGIDIDPLRIKEANENAQKAKVTDKVRFIQGDLFEADLKDATVVTLYLLPDVNMRLRPKLLRELKPGTRVVSHNYDMGDWKPEQTIKVSLPSGDHTVYYWVVPKTK
jgi:tRNA G37 N-methylase Trm5